VTKVGPGGGSDVPYSVQFGGGRQDEGHGIALDSSANAYITGLTSSTNFFTTNTSGLLSASFHPGGKGTNDAFVTVLGPSGADFLYSFYIGGTGDDRGNSIAVEASGAAAYITGETSSTNFPSANPRQTKLGGVSKTSVSDAFVEKIEFP
jgi:hypothetical protein